jgi:hypothetical protein
MKSAARIANRGKMGEKQIRSDHSVLVSLLGPLEPELGCEECFAELDRYVELELREADADMHIPGMREHLEGCSACAEDHRSLRALVVRPGGVSAPTRQ